MEDRWKVHLRSSYSCPQSLEQALEMSQFPKMNQPYFTVGSRKPEVVRVLAGVAALRVQTLNFIRTVAEPERRALMRNLFEVIEAPGENEAPAVFRLSQRGWTEAPPTFPAAALWTPPPTLCLPPTDIRSRLNFLPLQSSAQRSDYGLSARL